MPGIAFLPRAALHKSMFLLFLDYNFLPNQACVLLIFLIMLATLSYNCEALAGSAYLAPHPDDIALSCAGSVLHDVRQRAQPLVLTVFSAEPGPDMPLSDFCREIHQEMGLGGCDDQAVSIRRAEDRAAMDLLGCIGIHLAFFDAIYRHDPLSGGGLYNSVDALTGPVHPHDTALIDQIADAVENTRGIHRNTQIYAPLAIGNHVDHQIVHAVGLRLRQRGYAVSFYEDFPYADPTFRWNLEQPNPRTLEAALLASAPAIGRQRLLALDEATLAQRVGAIAAYHSQLRFMFDDQADLTAHVRALAQSYVPGQLHERFWY